MKKDEKVIAYIEGVKIETTLDLLEKYVEYGE